MIVDSGDKKAHSIVVGWRLPRQDLRIRVVAAVQRPASLGTLPPVASSSCTQTLRLRASVAVVLRLVALVAAGAIVRLDGLSLAVCS